MIALNNDLEIWPTSPLIFTLGVQKVQNLAFEVLWFQNGATYHLSFSSLGVSMVFL